MATFDGMGYSTETEVKQAHLRMLLDMHLRVCKTVIEKFKAKPYYCFYDINCGCGRDKDGNPGSPLIFLEVAEKHDCDYRALFLDKKKIFIDSLIKEIGSDNLNVHIRHGEQESILPKYFPRDGKYRIGFLYTDPNGIANFDLLSAASRQRGFDKLDILINCNAAAIKRYKGAFGGRKLIEHLREINKKYWVVREPVGCWQWSMLIGTQWMDFPKLRECGFYDISSKRGMEIFDRLNLTHEELKCKQ